MWQGRCWPSLQMRAMACSQHHELFINRCLSEYVEDHTLEEAGNHRSADQIPSACTSLL